MEILRFFFSFVILLQNKDQMWKGEGEGIQMLQVPHSVFRCSWQRCIDFNLFWLNKKV